MTMPEAVPASGRVRSFQNMWTHKYGFPIPDLTLVFSRDRVNSNGVTMGGGGGGNAPPPFTP